MLFQTLKQDVWILSWMSGQGTQQLYDQRKLNVKFKSISRFKRSWFSHWMSFQFSKQLECVSRTLNQDLKEVEYQSKLIEKLIGNSSLKARWMWSLMALRSTEDIECEVECHY